MGKGLNTLNVYGAEDSADTAERRLAARLDILMGPA